MKLEITRTVHRIVSTYQSTTTADENKGP